MNEIKAALLACGWTISEDEQGVSAHDRTHTLRVSRPVATGDTSFPTGWTRARLNVPEVDGDGNEYSMCYEYEYHGGGRGGLQSLLQHIRRLA